MVSYSQGQGHVVWSATATLPPAYPPQRVFLCCCPAAASQVGQLEALCGRLLSLLPPRGQTIGQAAPGIMQRLQLQLQARPAAAQHTQQQQQQQQQPPQPPHPPGGVRPQPQVGAAAAAGMAPPPSLKSPPK